MNVTLVLFRKDGTQKVFHLPSKVTVIGRRHNCDLCIPLMSVSKKHCQINFDGGVLKVRDLGSRNGTVLNGKRIEGEAQIKAGDTLTIGPVSFVFQIDGKPETISQPAGLPQVKASEAVTAQAKADDQFGNAVGLEEESGAPLGELDSLEDDLGSLGDNLGRGGDELELLDDED